MPRTPFHLVVVAALLMSFGALGWALHGPATSEAAPFHGIGLAKGCTSPIVVGQLYTCDVLTINNLDTAGDTLTITSIVDVVHAGAGDQTSGNLLPGLSLILSGGATCSFGQLICTLPAGSSITTASPYGFYVTQASDPNPLPDTVYLTWQDLCTSLALNCPIGDLIATAGSSAILQSPTPTATFTSTPTATSTATPTSTPTNTPTATNTPTPVTPTNTPVPPTSSNTPLPGTSTPTGPFQHKTCLTTNGTLNTWDTEAVNPPTGQDGNANAAGNECNLFICIPNDPTPMPTAGPGTPTAIPDPVPCSGPGEGDLVVLEQVENVSTTPADMGLGAYEFTVEFDSFAIQSVNPQDIIFTTGCPIVGVPLVCGTAPSNTNGFPGGGRGAPICSFSIAFENSVRFACVTNSTGGTSLPLNSAGLHPGPIGSFTLAKLDLVPAADDLKDLFPGNNNGIATLIKDNQCELADILGHPVNNTVNPLGTVTPIVPPTMPAGTPTATFPTPVGGGGAGQLPICGDLLVTIRILEGDLNLDCRVDVFDEALIAAHYGSFFGSAFYNKWFDLEPSFHDLDIDIKDVQKVFGRDGSTCADPIPLQTPVQSPFDLNG